MEPTQFGNYTLLERISHGGMAEVFRAKSFGEAGFEREVALKVLLPNVASDEEFVTMLIDEAKIAGQLNHTNIAQIFDLGVADGQYYIVQEFVKGKDLRSILQYKAKNKTHFEIATACYIALKVCEGLHYAHNKRDPIGNPLNVVHRDISPHNILISNEGEVKVVDFGIAKAEGRSTKTLAGLVKGKFAYMSPEQIRGLPVDHRSDVFATGIVLHEMLTSRALFRGATEFETLKRAREAIVKPPSVLRPEIPPELDAIVLKSLARHVHDRYQSSDEFKNALWTFAREHDVYSRDIVPDLWKEAEEPTKEHDDTNVQFELASEVSAVENTIETDPVDLAGVFPAEDVVHDHENSTVVDPGPFGSEEYSEDEELYTPTDHDAQWAANLGPLREVTNEYGQASPVHFDEPISDIETRPTSQFTAPSIQLQPAQAKVSTALAHADTESVPAISILRPQKTPDRIEPPSPPPVVRYDRPATSLPPAAPLPFQFSDNNSRMLPQYPHNHLKTNRRMYLVLAAIFALFLVSAATITLLIRG